MKITEQLFTEEELNNFADVLIWGLKTARGTNGNKFRRRENVYVPYDLAAMDLATHIQVRLLELGLNPIMRAMSPCGMEHNFFTLANRNQLIFRAPGSEELFRNLHGYIGLRAPESLTHLKDIDSGKLAKFAVANKYRHEILDEREEKGLFGWTLTFLPTEATAEAAGLSVEEFTRQVVKACFLDHPDPVGHWGTLKKESNELKKWLNAMLPNISSFHVESANVDLTVTPGEKRKFVGFDGCNIPSFELFISPDWRGTEGVYYADQPSFRSGHRASGIRLEFAKGSAVKIEAEEDEEFVKGQLTMDKGANKLGEFSLTDIRFSQIDKFMANTLFDENFGGEYGNCHVATGASYADTFAGEPEELTKDMKTKLGFNDSALHWDLVNTENKTVTARMKDGGRTVIYDQGMFKH